MKKLFEKVSITIVVFVLITVFAGSLFSVNAEETNAVPIGDSAVIPYSEYQSVEEQLREMLLECKTDKQRQMLMKKAYQLGIDRTSFDGLNLSENELSILQGETCSADVSAGSQKRSIITSDSAKIRQSRTVVAGGDMPDYVLRPSIYWQDKSDYCSAATIVIIADYLGANAPEQATIMKYWKNTCGVTYPDLPLVRNYLNNVITGKPDDYVRYVYKKYAGSQNVFNADLKNNVLNYQPMVILMKSVNTSEWPYITPGHFCVCSGLFTWEGNKYFIGDPYYWTRYLSSVPNAYGEHKVSWTNLNNVIGRKFGFGSQYYLT